MLDFGSIPKAILFKADKRGSKMTGEEFVKLCFTEKEASLKQYFDERCTTEVGSKLNHLLEDGGDREALYTLLNLVLNETYYNLLLALDGEASLGGKKVNYKLFDDEMNQLNDSGAIEMAAYQYFMEA